jgi:LPXTG-motif cell wall-anchored protein
VPVAEDQPYNITIKGEGGFKKSFSGVLDCKTAGSGGGKPSSRPSPASVGGSTGGDKGGDLAETGSSNATPMIAGIAVVLVVVGGAAVFFLRKKKTGTPAQ